MENQSPSLARHPHNGVLKLPPGFRFHPTDEELVLHYLRRKVLSCPLPASIIPDIDLSRFNPWDLPGGCEQERYFFAVREAKYPNGNRSNRAAGCGYWKATGKDRAVAATKIKQVVGSKKTLVFYRGKAPSGSRTDWIMHEYRLPSSSHLSTRDWVLCRIFLKKGATRADSGVNGHREEGRRAVGFIDFMGRQPASPSASDSSCVTESVDESSHREDATSTQ